MRDQAQCGAEAYDPSAAGRTGGTRDASIRDTTVEDDADATLADRDGYTASDALAGPEAPASKGDGPLTSDAHDARDDAAETRDAAQSPPPLALAVGGDGACGIDVSGSVRCWGNVWPDVGGAVVTAVPAAVPGHPELRPAAICVGQYDSCALMNNGSVTCWGHFSGTFGAALGSYTGAEQVVCGSSFACARHSDGTVSCWGHDTWDVLGRDATVTGALLAPSPASRITKPVDQLAAGGAHTCARYRDGSVGCWGFNNYGQLGTDGHGLQQSAAPVTVPSLPAVRTLAVGNEHSCALSTDGRVFCWGRNSEGQLGNAANLQGTPMEVSGLTGPVVSLSAGGGHTCAIVEGGTIACWGANDDGQLGTGPGSAQTSTPTTLTLTGATLLGAGNSHTCALTSSSGLVCWGYGFYGQIGNGASGTGPAFRTESPTAVAW